MVVILIFIIICYFLRISPLIDGGPGLLQLTVKDVDAIRSQHSFFEDCDDILTKVYRRGLFSLLKLGREPISRIHLLQRELRRYERRLFVQKSFLRVVKSKVLLAFILALCLRVPLVVDWRVLGIFDLFFLICSGIWGSITIILSWTTYIQDWCQKTILIEWIELIFEERASQEPWLELLAEFHRIEMNTGVSTETDKLIQYKTIADEFHQESERKILSDQDKLGTWELMGTWPIIFFANIVPFGVYVGRLGL